MPDFTFTPAVKTQSRLRLALAGPAGAGKTFTALKIGSTLANGGKVALIDTEHGSADKYSDLWSFDRVPAADVEAWQDARARELGLRGDRA